MKQFMICFWLMWVLVLSVPIAAAAQAKVKLNMPESKITVRGTSSLHDWEVAFEKYDIEFDIREVEKGKMSIGNVKAVFEGASVTSDNSIMTGKARDALMIREHPEIVFGSGGAENLIINDGKITGKINGNLFIRGVSRSIDVSFSGTINGDRLVISGTEEVNMSDYGIKPPTAMLGALKTGEKVVVELHLSFLIPGGNTGSY